MRHATLLLASLGVLAYGAAAANAADVYVAPRQAPPPVRVLAPAPVATWSGLYLGIQGGYASDTASFTAPGETVPFGSVAAKGWFGGAKLGYDWQYNSLVFGVMGDISAGAIHANATSLGGGGSDLHATIDWLSTIRGRVGFALDRLLIYATGGVAFGHATATLSNLATGDLGSGSASNTHVGWAGGLGAEYALSPNLSVNAEWLYTDFGSKNYHFQDAAGSVDASTHLTGNNFLVGLNYRFK